MIGNKKNAVIWAWVMAGSAAVLLAGAGGPSVGQETAPPPRGKASVTLVVPADAEVFFNGVATPETGDERVYTTPELRAGMPFHYHVLVRWKSGGKVIERRRKVIVSAGSRVFVNFVGTKKEGPKDEKKGKVKEEKEKETVTSRAEKRVPATAIDFKKAFGLPLDSLGTLGSRIEAARRKPDPVALGHAASELAVAEKVSKKKASLTSTALFAESAELARLRRKVVEMKSLYEVKKQIADEATDERYWSTQIALAEKTAREESAAVLRGMPPTDAPRRILVNNYSTQYVDLWVNGTYKMQVPPGGSKWCVIEHKWNPTKLTGWGSEDAGAAAWHRTIWGDFKSYTWNLKD